MRPLTPATPASPLLAKLALAASRMRFSNPKAGVAGVTGVDQCVRENTSYPHTCTRTCSGWNHPCYPCHPCYRSRACEAGGSENEVRDA